MVARTAVFLSRRSVKNFRSRCSWLRLLLVSVIPFSAIVRMAFSRCIAGLHLFSSPVMYIALSSNIIEPKPQWVTHAIFRFHRPSNFIMPFLF